MRRILLCVCFALCTFGQVAFSNVPDSIDIKWMVGGNIYSQSTCEYAGDVILPDAPTKRGHTFVGWRRNYVELEYLESTGTQYIDTGVNPTKQTNVEVIYKVLQYSSGNNVAIYGAYSQQVGCFIGAINNGVNYINDTNVSSSSVPAFELNTIYKDLNVEITLIRNGKNYVIPQVEASDFNIYIFGRNASGKVERIGQTQIYKLKIIQDSVLVRDFIPVLDLSGVPCMYDRVTNEFFYNQGTGQFIAGPIKS